MSQGNIDENGQYQDPPNFCPACKWTECQNLSNRQIAGMKAAATRAKNN